MKRVQVWAKHGYLALLMGALAACAADPSKQAAKSEQPTESDPSKGIICTNDATMGSFIKKKKCTTPEQREALRRESEHQMVIETSR